jgi:hypothetical protein
MFTSREPDDAAIAFHKRMQIGGIGWKRVGEASSELGNGLYEWVLVTSLLLCILLGTGKLLFHEWAIGGVLIGCAVVLSVPFIKTLKSARAHY